MKNKWMRNLLLTIFFLLVLYLVEFSPIGSANVAKYNNGYGTFDMKDYSVTQVRKVLSDMQPEGFTAYRQYLAADYLFVLAFGAFQLMLLSCLFASANRVIRGIAYLIPVMRGIFDLVENTLLLVILQSFPDLSDRLIEITGTATQAKLICIRIFILEILIGIFLAIFRKRKKLQ